MKKLDQIPKSNLVGNYFSSLVLSLAILIHPGCGTWIGNPKNPTEGDTKKNANVSIQFVGTSATSLNLLSSITVIGKSGTSIGTMTLTDARVALKEIKIKAAKNSSTSDAEFKGPYIVNLLTNQVSPDPGTIEIASGLYKEMVMSIHQVENDQGVAESDPLYKNSIYLKGTFTPLNGAAKSFAMSFELTEEFSLTGMTGATRGLNIGEGGSNPIIVAFRLPDWFKFNNSSTNEKNLDFSDISASTIAMGKEAEGTLKDIKKVIKENIKKSAKFGKDADKNGKLESEEEADEE